MSGITVPLTAPLPLSLTLGNGASGFFPQAEVRVAGGAAVAGSPFDLAEFAGSGSYENTAFTPLVVGRLIAKYVVYSDGAHTILARRYQQTQDVFTVLAAVLVPPVPPTAAAIATAVWTEALPGAFPPGSAGERLATTDDTVAIIAGAVVVISTNVSAILAATGLAARGSLISDAANPDNLEVEAWLERLGEPITAGLVSATATLFNPDGTILFGPTAMVAGANGLFRLSVPATLLSDVTNFVLRLVVTDATGAVVGYMATPTLA